MESTAPLEAVKGDLCGVAVEVSNERRHAFTMPSARLQHGGNAVPVAARLTPVTFTSSTVDHVSSLVSTGPSSSPGEMPALL
ncbi:MAG: hypothetical protein R2715_23330 [Ilumatobacteraceae bacterium]